MTRKLTYTTCVLPCLGILLFAVMCRCAAAADEVTFLSSQSTETASVGDTVVFECIVDNLGTHAVDWWYLDHHLQISHNQRVLVNDSHFSILQPLGNQADMNHLKISPIKISDAGHYQCSITGTSYVQTHSLVVTDAPVIPTPDPQHLPAVNFTDCCLRETVSPSCLPVCSPSTLDLNQFDINQCFTDLPTLIRCGADNRNHVSCCRQHLVPNTCLGFCMGEVPAILDKHVVCLYSAKDIIECFEEGQYILPTEPYLFHVEAESSSTIHASWQPPLENSDTITGYRLFYKKDTDQGYQSTRILDVGQLDYTLTGLEADTLYTLYVISVNSHGASQPTYRLQAATHPRNPLPPGINRQTFEQCCVYRGVTERCRPILCGEGPVKSDVSMIDCFPEVNKVFQCMSGERNHTACCREQDIPEQCDSLCSGQVFGLQLDQLKCISMLPQISSCFDDGSRNLPGAPRGLSVLSVTSSTAMLEWSSPVENEDLVEEYRIRYWISHTTSNIMQESVSGQVSTALISGLEPGTQYTMEVFAVGKYGTSIPSPTVLVITHDIIPVPGLTERPQPAAPFNESACCITAGVREQCLPMCNYKADFNQFNIMLLLECQPEFGKLLMCGTDGRNHTSCCQGRYVPEVCLKFCAFTQDIAYNYTARSEDLTCVNYLSDVLMCMQEGLVSLPSPPQDVTATSTTQTITLHWNLPKYVPPNTVLKYLVSWTLTNETKWSEDSTSLTSYTIHNLATDTEYKIQIIAATDDGYSLPSPHLLVRTKPDALHMNITLPTNITGCCREVGVSDRCLEACSGNAVVDLNDCSSDMLKVLQCAADGRDHSPCCTRSDLPTQCLSHCRGQPKADSFLHLLCMTFIPQILTCFRQGYKELPSPPRNFHAAETGPKFARLTWDPPEQNAEGVQYKLYYIGAYDTQDHMNLMDVVSPYYLNNLKPGIPYTVFLIAYNQYGTSLPTPKIQFVTRANESPVITITQDPADRYLKEGHKVVLSCHATGQPLPTVRWLHNGVYFNTQTLRLGPLTAENTGRYTCVAENGDQPVTENVILNVQYAPLVTPAQSVVYVPPSQYKIAQLQCNIRGFPDHIVWLKDGITIVESDPDSARYMWRREVQEDKGIIEAHFDISAVSRKDYGTYTCKVNNTFGSHDASIILADPGAATLPPWLTTASPVTNVTACCVHHGVRDSCLRVCSFDIDLSVLLEMTPEQQGECLQDGDKMIACLADGRNHSSCCMKQNLQEQCLPFCLGYVPQPLWKNQSSCLLYMEEIVDCMEEGREILPSPPLSVRAQLIDGFIQVWWHPPRSSADKVEYYDILSWNTDMSDHRNISVSKDVTIYNISSIHSMSEYTIEIEARNHYGTSVKSNRVKIQTFEMKPSPPYHLSAVTLPGARVLLHWNMPIKYSGAVISYNVYYTVTRTSQTFKKVNTYSPNVRYTLEGLQASTNYSLYLTAVSSHFESKPSELITVLTEQYAELPPKHKSPVLIPVVAVLVILALIAAVSVFIYWYFRVHRGSHQRFKDAVSFENPGYASHGPANGSPGEARAWISRLPSEVVMTTTGDSAVHQSNNGVVEARVTSRSDVHKNGGLHAGGGAESRRGDVYPKVQGQSSQSGLVPGGDRANNSSIMNELDSSSDQGYATLSHSTSNGVPATVDTHSCAMLNITPTEPVDMSKVELDVTSTVI